MLAIARIGNENTPLQGQDTHLVVWLQAIIPLVVIGEGGGNVLRWLVQALVASLGLAFLASSVVLLHLRPQRLVGRTNLAGNIGCHLCRQMISSPYLVVRFIAQAYLIAQLAMLKRVATHVVQGITILQLCGSQALELCMVGMQFEFDGDNLLHRKSVLKFRDFVNTEYM